MYSEPLINALSPSEGPIESMYFSIINPLSVLCTVLYYIRFLLSGLLSKSVGADSNKAYTVR